MSQGQVDQLLIEVLGKPLPGQSGGPEPNRRQETFPFFNVPRGVKLTAIGGIYNGAIIDGATENYISFAQPFAQFCYWAWPTYQPAVGDSSPVVFPTITSMSATGFTFVATVVSGTAVGNSFAYGAIGV